MKMDMPGMTLPAEAVVEGAINSMGLGYDLCLDLNLKYRKGFSRDSRLIAIDDDQVRNIQLPGGFTIQDVPNSIKCERFEGDCKILYPDVLSFEQMSEQFNQELSLSGDIPMGHFNAAFDFSGVWHKDAANTKSLAFVGFSITFCDIAFEKTQVVLRDYVKRDVPSFWDPDALARFIKKYGTHVIVGLKMGGTYIIYGKQSYLSPGQPDIREKVVELFLSRDPWNNSNIFEEKMQGLWFKCERKGGSTGGDLSPAEWCETVLPQPDVISMSFIPITSLLRGTNGIGYLTHAINAYLRYKPPIEELHPFLEFQIPRRWAPVFGVLALGPERKPQNAGTSQISLMAPKILVNTTPVDVGKKPVTGLRLYLEGKRSNCLAIHLQHLSSLPRTLQLQDELIENSYDASEERFYYKKVRLNGLSYVCTAPIESNDYHYIVTGAHFEVGETDGKKVLFLRLHFSRIVGAAPVLSP